MSDRGWAETLATGVTVVRDTVFPVGNVADPWGDYQKDRRRTSRSLLAANPGPAAARSEAPPTSSRPSARRSSACSSAPRTRSMVGPELDRLAQMKKDGVMTVQLTYNNAQSVGRRFARAGQCRPDQAGQGDDRADRGGEAVARPQPRRRADDGRGSSVREAAAGDQPYRRARDHRPSAQHRRRDDQGRCRQGRRRRRLFHAVPDARQPSRRGAT